MKVKTYFLLLITALALVWSCKGGDAVAERWSEEKALPKASIVKSSASVGLLVIFRSMR